MDVIISFERNAQPVSVTRTYFDKYDRGFFERHSDLKWDPTDVNLVIEALNTKIDQRKRFIQIYSAED